MSVSVPKLPVTRHQIRSGELPLIFLKQNWCLESFLARAAHEQEEEVPSAVPLGFNWGAQRRRYLCGHAFDSMEGRRFGTTQKACSSCFLHGVRVCSLGIFLLAVASSGCVLGFGLQFLLLHVLCVILYSTFVQPILVWQWSFILFVEFYAASFFIEWFTRRLSRSKPAERDY